jgi:WD40 repeat protein
VIKTEKTSHLYKILYDARRFILYNRSIIEEAPLQLYYSALIFAPEVSIIRQIFMDQVPPWIKRLGWIQKDWNSLLQTLEGHTSSVNAVAFSPDGKMLALASGDRGYASLGNRVQLWNAATGAALQTFENCLTYKLVFSTRGPYLDTDLGSLCIQTNCADISAPKSQTHRAVCLRENWITQGEKNLLWLPPDYRPACSAFQENHFVFGYQSGRVVFIKFDSC